MDSFLRGTASLQLGPGLHPGSPVQWCHPWQSPVCTTCGWSVSPSWVSQSSLRPGKMWSNFTPRVRGSHGGERGSPRCKPRAKGAEKQPGGLMDKSEA